MLHGLRAKSRKGNKRRRALPIPLCKDDERNCHAAKDVLPPLYSTCARRKIRLIEGNAKFRHLSKLSSKGILWQMFICPRPKTPHPPPLHTVYVYTVTYSHREGGRVEPERRLEGQQFTKLGRKYQHD